MLESVEGDHEDLKKDGCAGESQQRRAVICVVHGEDAGCGSEARGDAAEDACGGTPAAGAAAEEPESGSCTGCEYSDAESRTDTFWTSRKFAVAQIHV